MQIRRFAPFWIWAVGISCLWLCPAVSAQEEPPEVQNESQWYFGPVARMDGIQATSDENTEGEISGQGQIGMQFFHRMDSFFGTGANVLFIPEDSSFAISLDARWIWDLHLLEPYAGLELSYLTRSSGGLALAPKVGLQIEWPEWPILLDLYALFRYDVVAVTFSSPQSATPFNFGFGAALQYRID